MNEVTIFKKEEFGSVRTIEMDGKSYFCASDVAKILGYSNIPDAINRHCRCIVKHDIPHPQSKKKTIEMSFISEGDVYRLTASSKLPSAEKFESWIFDEVLPTIRETGSYAAISTISKDQLVLAHANNAQLLNSIAEDYRGKYNNTVTQILQAYATKEITGEFLLPLPETEKTYTATEIGKMIGKSSREVGSIANKHNLKTDEFGIWVLDKATNCNKEVQTFRYNEKGLKEIKKYL